MRERKNFEILSLSTFLSSLSSLHLHQQYNLHFRPQTLAVSKPLLFFSFFSLFTLILGLIASKISKSPRRPPFGLQLRSSFSLHLRPPPLAAGKPLFFYFFFLYFALGINCFFFFIYPSIIKLNVLFFKK